MLGLAAPNPCKKASHCSAALRAASHDCLFSDKRKDKGRMGEPFIIGITGHRPERLKRQEIEIKLWFEQNFKNFISIYDNVVVISGMARGVDQIAAETALKCGAKLWCYFPYKHEFKGLEKKLADAASLISYEKENYSRNSYYLRDKRIVNDCDLMMVVYDGKPVGGTYLTYDYANSINRDILLYDLKLGILERELEYVGK